VFLKEPEPGSYWRQGKLKDMTGDEQSGRNAHCPDTKSTKRSFVIGTIGNFVPLPEEPSDQALRRRVEWITTTNVFITDDRHKEEVVKQMSAETVSTASFKKADKNVLKKVMANPLCKSYFLVLIAQAWKRLIVVQKMRFYSSPAAAVRLEQYWKYVQDDQDSAVGFFNQCLTVSTHCVTPKVTLLAAYKSWFQAEKRTNGLPGDRVHDLTFFKRLKDYYQHASAVKEVKHTTYTPVVAIEGPELDEEFCGKYQSSRVNCLKGLCIQDIVTQFANTHIRYAPLGLVTIRALWELFKEWKKKPFENRSEVGVSQMSFPVRILDNFPNATLLLDGNNRAQSIEGIAICD
jgi:hypothetical protein